MTTTYVTTHYNPQTIVWALGALLCAIAGLWLTLRWAALPAAAFAVVAVIPLAFWLGLAGLVVGAWVTYPRSHSR